MEYQDYLLQKTNDDNFYGFDLKFIPEMAFDFQKFLLEWSIKKGRSAVFADCGLGKFY